MISSGALPGSYPWNPRHTWLWGKIYGADPGNHPGRDVHGRSRQDIISEVVTILDSSLFVYFQTEYRNKYFVTGTPGGFGRSAPYTPTANTPFMTPFNTPGDEIEIPFLVLLTQCIPTRPIRDPPIFRLRQWVGNSPRIRQRGNSESRWWWISWWRGHSWGQHTQVGGTGSLNVL